MRYGEPWFECHICGAEFPVSQGVRHYKSKKLVDANCADEPGHADYLGMIHTTGENTQISPQPVSNQGDD